MLSSGSFRRDICDVQGGDEDLPVRAPYNLLGLPGRVSLGSAEMCSGLAAPQTASIQQIRHATAAEISSLIDLQPFVAGSQAGCGHSAPPLQLSSERAILHTVHVAGSAVIFLVMHVSTAAIR